MIFCYFTSSLWFIFPWCCLFAYVFAERAPAIVVWYVFAMPAIICFALFRWYFPAMFDIYWQRARYHVTPYFLWRACAMLCLLHTAMPDIYFWWSDVAAPHIDFDAVYAIIRAVAWYATFARRHAWCLLLLILALRLFRHILIICYLFIFRLSLLFDFDVMLMSLLICLRQSWCCLRYYLTLCFDACRHYFLWYILCLMTLFPARYYRLLLLIILPLWFYMRPAVDVDYFSHIAFFLPAYLWQHISRYCQIDAGRYFSIFIIVAALAAILLWYYIIFALLSTFLMLLLLFPFSSAPYACHALLLIIYLPRVSMISPMLIAFWCHRLIFIDIRWCLIYWYFVYMPLLLIARSFCVIRLAVFMLILYYWLYYFAIDAFAYFSSYLHAFDWCRHWCLIAAISSLATPAMLLW